MKWKLCVHVGFFASIREKAKKADDNVCLGEGSSLENLFDILREKYPQAFASAINEHVFVINGRKVDPRKTIELHDKDRLDVFPLVGGG